MLSHLSYFNGILNSLSPGRCGCDLKCLNFKHNLSINIQVTITLEQEHMPGMKAREPHWWEVTTGLGNGMVTSGNKPLPEPVLTKIHYPI